MTAMARVDGEILLSAGRDGQVREWRWRSGACLRELLLSPSMVPFSAMSYHAATSSFALGNTHGEMCVFRRNPRNDDREPACYPLTSWVSLRGSHMSSHNEVASIQHDGDKVVFSTWLDACKVQGAPAPIGDHATPAALFAARREPNKTSKLNRVDGLVLSQEAASTRRS